MTTIQEEFSSQGLLHGHQYIFRAPIALKIIHTCRERRIRVLGIDGLIIKETSTQPTMEHSVDFTDQASQRNPMDCWQRAEQFLNNEIDSDLYFELVIEKDLSAKI